MKFGFALIAAVAAIKVQRMEETEDQVSEVQEEFNKLSQASETGFKVDVQSFGSVIGYTCKDGDRATVNYTGKLVDGRVFDSSIKEGFADPFKFTIGVGDVIQCWDQALGQMHVGSKATVTCPPNMAYGQESPGGIIPPNATLLFDIEVIDCQSGF